MSMNQEMHTRSRATRWLAALLAGAVVRGVSASSPERGAEVAEAWDVPRAYRDIGEALADPQVRAALAAVDAVAAQLILQTWFESPHHATPS